jgi:hypothetical protein
VGLLHVIVTALPSRRIAAAGRMTSRELADGRLQVALFSLTLVPIRRLTLRRRR